jgi:hypothetical protein
MARRRSKALATGGDGTERVAFGKIAVGPAAGWAGVRPQADTCRETGRVGPMNHDLPSAHDEIAPFALSWKYSMSGNKIE